MTRRGTQVKVRSGREAQDLILALTYRKFSLRKSIAFRGGMKGDRSELRRVNSLLVQAQRIAERFPEPRHRAVEPSIGRAYSPKRHRF
jgi:hypothetical protein